MYMYKNFTVKHSLPTKCLSSIRSNIVAPLWLNPNSSDFFKLFNGGQYWARIGAFDIFRVKLNNSRCDCAIRMKGNSTAPICNLLLPLWLVLLTNEQQAECTAGSSSSKYNKIVFLNQGKYQKLILMLLILCNIILLSGDVEVNPGLVGNANELTFYF